MRRLVLMAALLVLPCVAQAQNPQMNARRQMLQGQIVQRFMDHVSTQLALDAGTRARLEQQMRQSGDRRRQLARNTADLRRDLMVAIRDSSTSDAEINRLLGQMTGLRQQEQDLWKSDQDALARILTPRQRARFVFMWLRFNEQIRDMALRPGR